MPKCRISCSFKEKKGAVQWPAPSIRERSGSEGRLMLAVDSHSSGSGGKGDGGLGLTESCGGPTG